MTFSGNFVSFFFTVTDYLRVNSYSAESNEARLIPSATKCSWGTLVLRALRLIRIVLYGNAKRCQRGPQLLLLGRVALVAQRPIVIKLSRGQSVGRCVGLSSALWKNGGSDPDAVWHHMSGGSRDEADGGVWGSVNGKGYFWGRICGAPL